LLTEEHNAR